PDRRASFSKTMPHNDFGEVEPEAYRKWLAILASGDPAEFEHAPRDSQAVERLNDPQATYAIDLVGPDATALQLPAPPAFARERVGAEMIELYWLALMRDVPFHEYSGNSLASAAVADLRAGGFAPLDAARLFRGETAGDVRGPVVSQFLWHDIPYGLKAVDQRFRVPGPDQAFGDITFGNKNLLTLLAQASLLAQKTSYYQKWQVHRRARPESFGGRIDVHLCGRKSYDIHPAALHSDALARVKAATGSYLLPMAYPEGCPTHPSYPAAHAVNAGAGATALKAFGNDEYGIWGAV